MLPYSPWIWNPSWKSPRTGIVQVEVAERAVGEVDVDEPAERARSLEQPGPHADDRPAQEPRRVDQVAAVGQQEVPPPIGPSGRPAGRERLRAVDRDGLEVVGHRVADRPSRDTTP